MIFIELSTLLFIISFHKKKKKCISQCRTEGQSCIVQGVGNPSLFVHVMTLERNEPHWKAKALKRVLPPEDE